MENISQGTAMYQKITIRQVVFLLMQNKNESIFLILINLK